MFGRKPKVAEVVEEPAVEWTPKVYTDAERAEQEERVRSHREYCVEVAKRRHEFDVKERGKARQEYMPGLWIRQAAFKARARQASTDRLLRLPVKSC